MHEAGVGIGSGDSTVSSLFSLNSLHLVSSENLPLSSISDIKSNFTNNAVLSLTVVSAVEEQDTGEDSLLLLMVVRANLFIVVADSVS